MVEDGGVMTLTEFLLARITEDETQVNSHVAGWEAAGDDEVRHFVGPLRKDTEYPWMRVGPGRVLAECEAKRATIAAVWEWLADEDYREGCCHTVDEIMGGGICTSFSTTPLLLRPMAAVYADHPDYRDEWKP